MWSSVKYVSVRRKSIGHLAGKPSFHTRARAARTMGQELPALNVASGERGDQAGDGTAVDSGSGEGDSCAEGLMAIVDIGGDDASGDEDGGGVEEDDVAARAGFAGEDGA